MLNEHLMGIRNSADGDAVTWTRRRRGGIKPQDCASSQSSEDEETDADGNGVTVQTVVCVCVCARACVGACVRACVRVCVCVRTLFTPFPSSPSPASYRV